MSLTDKIKSQSSKKFQASDGTWYALQVVNSTNIIIEGGGIADIMALKNIDGQNGMEQLAMFDPDGADKAFKLGMQMKPNLVKAGLIGEYDDQGNFARYRYVDKPAVELEPGEINIKLIPALFLNELFDAIQELSPKPPALEADVVTTFPAV